MDQYGIYIIQKAIKLNDTYKKSFYDIIKEKKDKLKNIDLNDFKYRGAQKVLKELELLSKNQNNNNNNNSKIKNNNFNNMDYNYNYHQYNNNFDNRNNNNKNNNNKRKNNKRGRKNFRGK